MPFLCTWSRPRVCSGQPLGWQPPSVSCGLNWLFWSPRLWPSTARKHAVSPPSTLGFCAAGLLGRAVHLPWASFLFGDTRVHPGGLWRLCGPVLSPAYHPWRSWWDVCPSTYSAQWPGGPWDPVFNPLGDPSRPSSCLSPHFCPHTPRVQSPQSSQEETASAAHRPPLCCFPPAVGPP